MRFARNAEKLQTNQTRRSPELTDRHSCCRTGGSGQGATLLDKCSVKAAVRRGTTARHCRVDLCGRWLMRFQACLEWSDSEQCRRRTRHKCRASQKSAHISCFRRAHLPTCHRDWRHIQRGQGCPWRKITVIKVN
jgi:hypothetical protein